MSLLESPLWLVDSHCHLDTSQFDDDRLAVIARARAAGVSAIVIPGIDLHHCRQAIALAQAHHDLYAAVGIHPNSSGDFDAATETELRDLALSAQSGAKNEIPNKVVAYGEIGLDYYWDKVEPARQRVAFERQLELAAALGLPVIIHSRGANDDVAAILSEWVQSAKFAASPLAQRPFAGVLHAFSGDAVLAEAAYGWNFVLSLGGPVTFTNARQLHALVPQLRRDRLMLETDAPYLTPHPHRGQRNEPAYVALVCHKLAALYDVPAAQLAAESTALAQQFFGLTLSHVDPSSTVTYAP
ncbi:MAG: TatD family hydrolase [Caldilineaceae bacterium]|nr:TatD family hydrolase [Caldilineaceae bacterium]